MTPEQEVDKRLTEFINEKCVCENCVHYKEFLGKRICFHPELNYTMETRPFDCCECQEMNNPKIKKELDDLMDEHYEKVIYPNLPEEFKVKETPMTPR